MRRPSKASLELAIPLYIALGIAVFSVLQIAAASGVITDKFSRLEALDLAGREAQFRVLLSREEEALKGLVQSYAEWSESYEYAAAPDERYVTVNYAPEWLAAQRVDGVLAVSSDGTVLWASPGFDAFGIRPAAGAAARSRLDAPRDPRLFPADYGALPSSPISGFTLGWGCPALYASWPITDDQRTLEPRGLLVFMRSLDPGLLEEFAPGDDFGVSFLPEHPAADAPDGTPAPGAALERGPGGAELASYEPVSSPSGERLGYWRYRKSRSWTGVALSLIAWLAALALASGGGAYAVASITVKRRMVRPILTIRDHLDDFSESLQVPSPLESDYRDEIGELARHVNALIDKVGRQTSELDRLASTDGLTGLPNRRSLDAALSELERRAERARFAYLHGQAPAKKDSVACAILDVDFFKIYNDFYGHADGDEALKRIAGVIRAGVMRPGDLPSRYGGEEFAVVLPDTDEAGAVAVLTRICAAVEALRLPHEGSTVSSYVTISAGVAAAAIVGEDYSAAGILSMADKALYAAKAAGRNRVVAASSLGLTERAPDGTGTAAEPPDSGSASDDIPSGGAEA